MTTAGSAVASKTSNLTLSSALQLDSGAITSTGGTLAFAGGVSLGEAGTLDVTGSTLSVSETLNLSDGTFSSDNNSVLRLQSATTLSSSNPIAFGSLNFEGNVLTLGSATTQLNLTDATTALN
jgi:hypothetical protein